MSSRPRNGALRGAVALTAVLALASCASGADKAREQAAKDVAEATPAERLVQTKAVLDKASSIRMNLTSENLPKKGNQLVKGEGSGTHAPAFKGYMTVKAGGVEVGVPITATDGKVWARLPFSSGMKPINPKDYGAPDPAVLFSTDKGLSNLLPKTLKPTFAGEKREGKDVVKIVTGTLSGKDVASVLGLGNPNHPYDVTYGVTSTNELRTAKLTGPFYGSTTSTYSLLLDYYGEPVDIKPPA